jgi:hypothetical protein
MDKNILARIFMGRQMKERCKRPKQMETNPSKIANDAMGITSGFRKILPMENVRKW